MIPLTILDDVSRRNLELAREARRNNGHGLGGPPWLDLDVQAFAEFRAGKVPEPPKVNGDPAMSMMVDGIEGKEVLCLAGGGGQQSAQFSLCGASVTVLDLTPEQLELDRQAAEHYGYEAKLVQGDARDLSVLPENHYHRVVQPISSLYMPDLREVYRGVARVLRPDGLYYCDYTYPGFYVRDNVRWDGEAYVVRLSQPHRSGKILENDASMNYSQGEFFGEFNHLLSDIINGQISEGLTIAGVWESPRPGRTIAAHLEPGSEAHQDSVIPYGLAVVSRRSQQ